MLSVSNAERAVAAPPHAPTWRAELELVPGDFIAIDDALHVLQLARADRADDAPPLALIMTQSWEALRPHYDARNGHPLRWRRPLSISSAPAAPQGLAPVLLPIERELWHELCARLTAGDPQHDVEVYLPRANVAHFAQALAGTDARRGRPADPDGLDERLYVALLDHARVDPGIAYASWKRAGKTFVEALSPIGWAYDAQGELTTHPDNQGAPTREKSAINAWLRARKRVRDELRLPHKS